MDRKQISGAAHGRFSKVRFVNFDDQNRESRSDPRPETKSECQIQVGDMQKGCCCCRDSDSCGIRKIAKAGTMMEEIWGMTKTLRLIFEWGNR